MSQSPYSKNKVRYSDGGDTWAPTTMPSGVTPAIGSSEHTAWAYSPSQGVILCVGKDATNANIIASYDLGDTWEVVYTFDGDFEILTASAGGLQSMATNDQGLWVIARNLTTRAGVIYFTSEVVEGQLVLDEPKHQFFNFSGQPGTPFIIGYGGDHFGLLSDSNDASYFHTSVKQ